MLTYRSLEITYLELYEHDIGRKFGMFGSVFGNAKIGFRFELFLSGYSSEPLCAINCVLLQRGRVELLRVLVAEQDVVGQSVREGKEQHEALA